MTNTRKIVKVFLASPGDLNEERRTAKIVVDEFNSTYAEFLGYQVELIGWEDTVSVFGRPQATINRELERCELFVGVMWKKWGTPPDNNSAYTSGFEEEYKITVQRRLKNGSPEISLLFKEIDEEFLRDPGEDLKKVLVFKKSLIEEKTILFQNFTDNQDFEKKFRKCISSYLIELKKGDDEKISLQNDAPIAVSSLQNIETLSQPTNTKLSIEGAKFLRDFIKKTENESPNNPITAVEVARSRLLTNMVGVHGNDSEHLGVHDANLIYKNAHLFEFGKLELNGLLSSGLEHFKSQNSPLWIWLKKLDGFKRPLLPFMAMFESSSEKKVSALSAMTLISEPLEISNEERTKFLNSLFAEEESSNIKIAALEYLAECGSIKDIIVINQELARSDYRTGSAAAGALIQINLRESRDKAIQLLYDLQLTSINKKVLEEIFENNASLSNETLLEGIEHRNLEVRKIVLKIIYERKKLPSEIAEKLITDANSYIRYIAIQSLIENGRRFTIEEAKSILIKKESNKNSFGLSLRESNDNGKMYWSAFELKLLQKLSDQELEENFNSYKTLYNFNSFFILAERKFKLYVDILRSCIDDQFKAFFAKALDDVQNHFGDTLKESYKSLESHICKQLMQKALELLCLKSDPSDLNRVRVCLKNGSTDISSIHVKYFKKFGEWEDISLIITAIKNQKLGLAASFLENDDLSLYDLASNVIYSLGKKRLSELFLLPIPEKLLCLLIRDITNTDFVKLGDSTILTLLNNDNDEVRKVTSLKCVITFSKEKLLKTLSNYTFEGNTYFYNVVHWLDFGISVPQDLAINASKKIMLKI